EQSARPLRVLAAYVAAFVASVRAGGVPSMGAILFPSSPRCSGSSGNSRSSGGGTPGEVGWPATAPPLQSGLQEPALQQQQQQQHHSSSSIKGIDVDRGSGVTCRCRRCNRRRLLLAPCDPA
ncbi:hypothetical protein HK405_002536, partial [Cladochytrium tenue]